VVLLDIQTLDGTQYFWSDYEGYYPSKFLTGTRIQSSGGTSTLKYLLDFGLGANGVNYELRCAVKNNAAVQLQVSSQYNTATLQPGESRQIILDFTGSGSLDAQIRFQTINAADPIDCVACAPFVGKVGDVNLIPSANLNFTGWNVFSGATITLTQSFDVAPFQFYNGWIKSGCNFTCTKDMSSNAGDLLLQNLSGNTIDRDVALALKNHEFEGAYAVTRIWIPLLDVAVREFHCSLTEQNPKEDEAGARELQLFDPTQYVIAGDVQAETCTFRFKSAQCGSTGTAVSCPKRLVDCQDASRLAQERFNAIITTIPNTVFVPPLGGPGQKPQRPGATTGGPRSPLPQL
jgi:hypothetical protein